MELIQASFSVIPVFLLVAVGFIFAHWKKINLTSCDIAILSAILIIFAGVGLLMRLYFFIFGFTSRGFALPALFMNAGNMGIPLALFAFGQEGMQRATSSRSGVGRFHRRARHFYFCSDNSYCVLANSIAMSSSFSRYHLTAIWSRYSFRLR
jgi:hypothetical protein